MTAGPPQPADFGGAPLLVEGLDGGPASTPDRPEYTESMLMVMLGQYAVMQAVVAVTGLVRNKVLALRLGPSALGELVQLTAVLAAVMSVVTFGMQVSLSRNVAHANTFAERQAYLANANGMVLSLSVLATGGMFAFLMAGDLLRVVGLSASPEVMIAAGLVFASIPLVGLGMNYLSMLQGLLDVRGLASQRSLAVILATAISVPIVWVFGLVGAAASFLAMNALLAVLLGLRCRSLGYSWLEVRMNREVVGALAAFGLASMAAGFAQTFTDMAIRASLLMQYGPDANGLLQAPLLLAATVQGIVLGSIGSMSLATLSGATSTEDTLRTINRLLNVALPLSTVALGLLGLLGVPAMVVLYSGEFIEGASLLPWILCAGLVQVFVWVVGAPLLASGDRAIWLTLELLWNGARWAIAVALLPRYGATAVAMGMLFAFGLHLVLNILVIRSRYRVRLGWRHGARLLAGMAIVGTVAVIGAYWATSTLAMMTASVIWVSYAAHVARSTPVLAAIRSVMRRR